jgi:hypothetical protein
MPVDLRGSVEREAGIKEALSFYASFYDSVGSWTLRPGKIEPVLGENEVQRCRFCGGYSPGVSFQQQAHAVPEALGNKTLFTSYECDSCNQKFGRGIENDLGNWSKPMRTLGLISGKSGIPTPKGKSRKEWRVEGTQEGLHLKHHSEDVVATVDDVKKTMTLSLPRDSYTPRAVFKPLQQSGLRWFRAVTRPIMQKLFLGSLTAIRTNAFQQITESCRSICRDRRVTEGSELRSFGALAITLGCHFAS